ncbi:polyprenyl synthetase family protein [Flavobacteriales bacterium]|jgi:geranylgeranyl diphosphate synthase, type II|nr:polyprenyl synthetase family protein [Flavobacteriales bacterium]MDA9634633.1 polyprenyl synthetase family protein [bacterium]MDC1063110.1 polyprenyl synthetase family protein [Flavobacteriales bacterium]
MISFITFKELIDNELNKLTFPSKPSNLYDPIKYILSLEAKRMRSIALLLSHNSFNENYENALPAALAIELFHNFTLIHDDIMDKAKLRRGAKTVHEKWDNNIAILSGDTMLVQSYSLLSDLELNIQAKVYKVFSDTATQVCEGQQLDMDFEQIQDLEISEYIEMIQKKTSVLLAASFQIGALIANASIEDSSLMYQFGLNIGIAFQLQDDMLDLYGEQSKFGKKTGGDIISNKKTYLYLKSLFLANSQQEQKLIELFSKPTINEDKKIQEVKNIFDEVGVLDHIKNQINHYHNKAQKNLEDLSITNKNYLIDFAKLLLKREF